MVEQKDAELKRGKQWKNAEEKSIENSMIYSIFFAEARTKTSVELIAVGVGSRSYGGFGTDTDQKMVLANVNIQGRSLYKRNSKKKEIKADTSNFRNKVMRDKYKEETAKIKVLEEMSTQKSIAIGKRNP